MEKLVKRPVYTNIEGVTVGLIFSPDAFRSAINYKPKSGDFFITTYMKCGTTWMQYIVMLILRRGKPFEGVMDLFRSSPFIELTGADAIDLMPKLGVIKSHLPLRLAPFSPQAKYICITRNPRDCCVSFYYHTKNLPVNYNFHDGKFSDFFDLFVKGEVEFDDYFDYLIPWYERRNDSNVHFLTYERLKQDTKREVLKIAKFLGEDYYKELIRDPHYLEAVLYYSSFDYMKKETNLYYEELLRKGNQSLSPHIQLPSGTRHMLDVLAKNPDKYKQPLSFIRKGIVGDWKNHFTAEQESRMEEYITKKTVGSDVMNLWNGLD